MHPWSCFFKKKKIEKQIFFQEKFHISPKRDKKKQQQKNQVCARKTSVDEKQTYHTWELSQITMCL